MNKRYLIVLAVFLALALSASAQNATPPALCSDTDNGGANPHDAALHTFGSVKYGLSTLSDTCLTSLTGVTTNQSKYLKEYYCLNDKRTEAIYDCTRYGYTGCQDGACVGTGTGTTGSSSALNNTANAATSSCGNHVIEKAKGEDCDPPDHICFGKTSKEYGLCDANCHCKIAAAAASAPAVCGDGVVDTGEECEADKDCPTNFLCSSCKCVKQLSQQDIDAMKNQGSTPSSSQNTPAPALQQSGQQQSSSTPAPITETNFSNEPGIKATSGFANFFKSIFSWISSLFG